MRGDVYTELRRVIDADELAALVTVVDGPGVGQQVLLRPDGRITGRLTVEEAEQHVRKSLAEIFSRHDARRVTIDARGGAVELFVEVFAPRPTLIVVGAVHIAIPLVSTAATLGFRTVVVDPRSAFATSDRFGHADAIVTDWPDAAFERIGLNASSYVAVLAHDLKIEVPALVGALRSTASYVGVLGSRRTHARRVRALSEAGLERAEIDRLHAPIGIDLGGRRPEEIALSIAAEIVAVRNGQTLT
jgi:xanthine dehydrogenase accessory factor